MTPPGSSSTGPSKPTGLTPAQLAVTEQHQAAAAHQAEILLARTRALVDTGVDLRNPAHYRRFANTEIMTAIRGASVAGCGCAGSEGVAAMSLVVELARRLAEATR